MSLFVIFKFNILTFICEHIIIIIKCFCHKLSQIRYGKYSFLSVEVIIDRDISHQELGVPHILLAS